MTFTFSPKALERVEWLRTRYPDQRAIMLPVLHMAQRENGGWISPEVITAVAKLIPVPEIWVKEVVTFYTMYNLKPVGRHHLQVCTNLCCALNGGEQLFEHLSTALGVGADETTADGEFHLSRVECLAACGYAPMMQVNDEFHEHLTFSKVNALLNELRARPQKADETMFLCGPGTGGPIVHPAELRATEQRVATRDQAVTPEHDVEGHSPPVRRLRLFVARGPEPTQPRLLLESGSARTGKDHAPSGAERKAEEVS